MRDQGEVKSERSAEDRREGEFEKDERYERERAEEGKGGGGE